MKICHCIIITSIQGLPLIKLITSPLLVAQNDASHTTTRTDVPSFTITGVPVVSLQWLPGSTCVCSFNLSSAAVLGSSSTQWGLCSAGATAGTLEHAQCTAQRQQGYVWIQILRLVVIKVFSFYETAHNNKSVSFWLSVKKTSNCAEGSKSGGHSQRIVNHNLSCIVCLYSLDILAKYGHV